MAFRFLSHNEPTLNLVAQYALPHLKQHRYIKVWDAGCAMAPEPYSIAILLREYLDAFQFRNVRIYATNSAASDFTETRAGQIHSDAELERIPRDRGNNYFIPQSQPGHLRVDGELRRVVHFYRHDLLSLQPILDDFGLIVCNSVLPHFTPAQRTDVIKMFHRALAEDGYLVLGRAQKLPDGTERLFHRVTPIAPLYLKA